MPPLLPITTVIVTLALFIFKYLNNVDIGAICATTMKTSATTYVEINNNLPAEITLKVHCKSKDDDLGICDITQFWGFSFTPNFFGGTLFFCSFTLPGQFEWFDIYNQTRDFFYCNDCIWTISRDGPCLLTNYGDFDSCYSWNPSTQLITKPLM
ncbi:hypothetical protein EUGRSUZ_G00233 [Eucalyptus grandis]|uniref:Uncharacterized protein n=2 Tax=Eucalyptus grandis TaxID=71139 RepID=A0ACC3JZW0_EUCGR|nr:hypothetical protein EUGRSUZ_G00233 [Eucalyptus grandis]